MQVLAVIGAMMLKVRTRSFHAYAIQTDRSYVKIKTYLKSYSYDLFPTFCQKISPRIQIRSATLKNGLGGRNALGKR